MVSRMEERLEICTKTRLQHENKIKELEGNLKSIKSGIKHLSELVYNVDTSENKIVLESLNVVLSEARQMEIAKVIQDWRRVKNIPKINATSNEIKLRIEELEVKSNMRAEKARQVFDAVCDLTARYTKMISFFILVII